MEGMERWIDHEFEHQGSWAEPYDSTKLPFISAYTDTNRLT